LQNAKLGYLFLNFNFPKKARVLLSRKIKADWLPDSSGKPGEALCEGTVPDLQRMAGKSAEQGKNS
jgi:hypothetical protein